MTAKLPERLPGWRYPSDHVALFAELFLMARSRRLIASSGSNMGVLLLTLAEARAENELPHFIDLEGQISDASLGAGIYFCDLPFGWKYMCGPGGVTCDPDGLRGNFEQRHGGEGRPLYRRECEVPAGTVLRSQGDWADAWRRETLRR